MKLETLGLTIFRILNEQKSYQKAHRFRDNASYVGISYLCLKYFNVYMNNQCMLMIYRAISEPAHLGMKQHYKSDEITGFSGRLFIIEIYFFPKYSPE